VVHQFEGNSQTPSHFLVSQHLLAAAAFEPEHVNAQFSDHDLGLTRA
jgi:hypothetical protein